VKVLDFGLAKIVAVAGGSTSPKIPSTGGLGTPLWMAPEQTDSEKYVVGPQADVWSLGLLAFNALTKCNFWRSGQNWNKSKLAAFILELVLKPIPAASERAAELGVADLLPRGFDGWFAKCVARDPADRFPHARDAGAALDEILKPKSPAGDGWFGETMPARMSRAPIEVVRDVFTNKEREEKFYVYQLPDATTMEMVYVPRGTFPMGDERTGGAREVTIEKAFYLGRFPVTRGQFAAFAKAMKHAETEWQSSAFEQDDDHPVVNVSWYDAKAYADWAKLGLPSQEQWEYAAYGEGEAGQHHPWGDAEASDELLFWNLGMTCAVHRPDYLRVPSLFGAKHLAGNVWEWPSSRYGHKIDADTMDGVGDGYEYCPGAVRTVFLYRVPPAYRTLDLGFRCVLLE
jgi:formylglycine-generating enzyme required for sulfatase activity